MVKPSYLGWLLVRITKGNVEPFNGSKEMVGQGRLELPTSRLSVVRSNQLSYKPGSCR